MKKSKVLFLSLVAIVICGVFFCFLFSKSFMVINNFNMADIAEMNIGAEMPKILYADTQKVVLYGTCGVLVYSLEERNITNRIDFEWFDRINVLYPECKVSIDGKNIYISEENIVLYKYNITSKLLTSCFEIKEPLYYVESTNILENQDLKNYIDFNYLLGENVAKTENKLIYLRAKKDWSMSSLQIMVFDINSYQSEIYNIFTN